MRKRKKCAYEIIILAGYGEIIKCYDFGFITDIQKRVKNLNKTKAAKQCKYKAAKLK